MNCAVVPRSNSEVSSGVQGRLSAGDRYLPPSVSEVRREDNASFIERNTAQI